MIECGAIEDRVCPNWSMAFVDATGLHDLPLLQSDPALASISSHAMIELLRDYVLNPI